ncbi:alpha/beta hydrolase family protein [Streptomyces olivochromogenes]|uniref:alpha/beta hydrolase family protein n=1 Tax=Streptomyces olivochromogenes TaxID=1963 RepID=UPI0036DC3258
MNPLALFAERERDLINWTPDGPLCVSVQEDGLLLEDAAGNPIRTVGRGADIALFANDEQQLVSVTVSTHAWEVAETSLDGTEVMWQAPLPADLRDGWTLTDAVTGIAADGRRSLVVTMTADDGHSVLVELAEGAASNRLPTAGDHRLLVHDVSLDITVLEEERGPELPVLHIRRCDGTPVLRVNGHLRDVCAREALIDVGDAVEIWDLREPARRHRVETPGELTDARFVRGGPRVLLLTCETGQNRARLTDPPTALDLGDGALRICAAHERGIGLHRVSTLGESAWLWLSPDGSVDTRPGTVPAFPVPATTRHLWCGDTPVVLHCTDAPPTGLLIAIHGGPEGLERDELRWEGVYRDLLADGIAVLGLNYAGSTGYGRAHRERPWRDWESSLRTDLSACLELAQELSLGRSRIGLLGGSFGADVALLYAGMVPGLAGVVACSPMAGLTDFREHVESENPAYAAWFDARFSKADYELFAQNSLLTAGQTPVVIVQGDADVVVDPERTARLVEAATDAELGWRLVREQGTGHQPSSPDESASRHALLRRELRLILA